MSEPKAILVVGDLMIDRNWVVPNKSALSTSQAHDDIPPRKLINPLWRTDLLGGMGFIVRTVVAAAPHLKVFVVSGWSDGFDPREYLFPEPKDTQKANVDFVQVVKTPFNTEKFRVYEESSSGPRLVYRFDRDLYWDQDLYQKTSISWPDKREIGLVIVTDFAKGLLDSPDVQNELGAYAEEKVPFLLDAKRNATHAVFQKLPWTLTLPNREEFARLIDHDLVEVPSFHQSEDKARILNPRLAEGLEEFAKKFQVTADFPERSILVKLDREGALLYERRLNTTGQLTALILPPDQKKMTGIGAGDVTVSQIAVNLIAQNVTSGSYDYVAACTAAIRSATAFCQTGTTISHSLGSTGWYGISVDENSNAVERIKAGFKPKTLGSPSTFVSVLAGREEQALRSTQILDSNSPKISIKDAKWFLDGFLTVDRELGADILRLRSHFNSYFEAVDSATKPFVAALCGTPGSGKSALADALPKAFECDVIKQNAAQWTSIEDLFRLCEEIRTVRVKGGKPFVFIDEVDAAVASEKLYGKLLAPLGDGAYSSFGYVRQLGPAAFLVAGSNEPWDTVDHLRSFEEKKDHPKLRDLISRFSVPPVQVPALKERPLDALYLAAFLLHQRFPGMKTAERGVMKLLSKSTPKYGPRSIKEVVRMFDPLKNPACVTAGDLGKAAHNVIDLHLEGVPDGWNKDTLSVEIVP